MKYLNKDKKNKIYPELDIYVKYKFSCLPVAKNAKNPIEKDWTNKTHYNRSEWIDWIKKEYNLGIRTGKESGITVVDLDLKEKQTEEQEKIIKQLDEVGTLVQDSPHGKHYIFKYDKDIPQLVNINNLHVDTRNDGGQILCFPSKKDNLNYYWKDLKKEIKILPKNIKEFLLSTKKVDKGRLKEKAAKEMVYGEIHSKCHHCDKGKNCSYCHGTGIKTEKHFFHIVNGQCIDGDTLK